MSEHEYFEQLCSSSIDGTLTDDEKRALEAHLAECPSCAALREDMEQLRTWLGEEQAELPEGLHGQIMQAVRAQEQQHVVHPQKPVRRMPVFTMVAAAAVVVLVVAGGGIGTFFGATVGMSGTADSAAADASAAMDAGDMEMAIEGNMPADAAFAAPETETDEEMFAVTGAADASAEAAPSDGTPAPASEPEQGAAATTETAPVTTAQPRSGAAALPDGIAGRTVAHCYFAEGAGELPDVPGDLLLSQDGVSYFLLPSSMEVLSATLAEVEQAGYEVSEYNDVGLVTDPQAESWLLIVSTVTD